jgi:hypothetical protein
MVSPFPASLMHPGFLLNWQTLAQSLARVPWGPEEKTTRSPPAAPTIILTLQIGQVWVVGSAMMYLLILMVIFLMVAV